MTNHELFGFIVFWFAESFRRNGWFTFRGIAVCFVFSARILVIKASLVLCQLGDN